MSSPTIEHVVFRLKDGVEPEAFESANEAVDRWLLRQPGFIQRQLAKAPDGSWFDIVRWSDHGAAEAAAEAFPTDPEAAGMMAFIDLEGMSFQHLEPVRDVASVLEP